MSSVDQSEQRQDKGMKDYALFRISFLVVALLGLLVIMPSLLFAVGISISAFTFPAAAILALCLYFYAFKFSKATIRDGLIAAAIIAVVIVVSGLTIDVTLDGVAYQKTAVGALANGWNPYQGSIDDWAATQTDRQNLHQFSLWIDHYPKATWFVGASIYALTGNIECGKVFTLMMMIVIFGVLYSFLSQRGLKKWQALIVATLAAVNPISMPQFISFYNDALLMLCLFVIVVCLTSLLYKQEKAVYFMLFFTLVICSNIKFTGLVYALAFCCMYIVALLLLNRKHEGGLISFIKPATLIFMGTMVLAILAGPYISNMEDHGNAFYPLIGPDSVDIMTPNQPDSFSEMSAPEKVFYSLFSSAEDLTAESGIADPQLKVPFTVSEAELEWLGVADLRISGFGVFFGPILIISVVVILAGLIVSFKKNRLVFFVLLGNTILITLMMFAISESWWARYSGYLYGATLAALVLIFWYINERKKKGASKVFLVVGSLLFTGLIAANTALFFPIERLEESAQYQQDIESLRELSQKERLTVSFSVGGNEYTGLYDNLLNGGVEFDAIGYSTEDMELTLNYHVFYTTDQV